MLAAGAKAHVADGDTARAMAKKALIMILLAAMKEIDPIKEQGNKEWGSKRVFFYFALRDGDDMSDEWTIERIGFKFFCVLLCVGNSTKLYPIFGSIKNVQPTPRHAQ